jgi:dipeptidyl aminopeptidase/acylaminoacyl peptidase
MWDGSARLQWSLEGQSITRPAMAFSPDSQLASVAADARILVLDANTGAQRTVLHLEPAEVTALAFSPDNQRLAVGTADGLTHLYELGSGTLIATLAAEAEGSLAYTPDAFYSGTLTHSTALSFRLGDRVYPLRQFDLYYDRPDILMQRLAPELGSQIRAYQLAYRRRLQEANVTESSVPRMADLPTLSVGVPAATTVDSPTLVLPITAQSPANSRLQTLEVRVNGVVDQRLTLGGRHSAQIEVLGAA